MAFRLRNHANKLHNYSFGASSEQLAQVRAHLDQTYQELRPFLDKALGVRVQQVNLGRVGTYVTRREVPYDQY
jgi:hypothetical protein